MNNGIFDFRKKIAFAAALLFVSHTLYSLPAAEAAAAVMPTADMHPTAAQEENEPDMQTEEYTVTFVNHTVSKADYAQLVYKLFGPDVRHSYEDWNATGTITAAYGAEPSNDKMAVGEYIYKRNTEKEAKLGDNNIVLETYAVVNGKEAFENEVEFSGLVEGSYCLIGGEFYVTPKNNYVIGGDTAPQTIAVNGNINLQKKNENTEEETYTIAVSDSLGFDVAPRRFTINTGGEDISIFMNGKYYHSGSSFKWKEAGSIMLGSLSAVRMTVYCGEDSFTRSTANGWFSFSNVLANEAMGYRNNADIRVSIVPKHVNVVFNFEDDEERSGISRTFDITGTGSDACFRVPYLEDGNYYLAEYEYGGTGTVNESTMYDDIVAGNRFFSIPAKAGNNTITLTYRKFDRYGDYDYEPETDITKRSDQCYTIDSFPSSTLMTFPPEFGDSVIVYDYFGGSSADGSNYGKYLIDSTNKKFIVNTNVMNDLHFFLVKDILRKNNGVVNVLDGSICFYIDKSAPSSAAKDADTDQPIDRDKWTGKDGLRVSLDVTDTEECPLADNSGDKNKAELVREVYDKYINAPTVNKQEIRSVIVGDHRFDRPEGGWETADALSGYIENSEILTAEKKAVELLKNTDLAELGVITGEQGDSYYYYKKLLREGICDEVEKKLSPELADLDTKLKALKKEKNDLETERELELAKEAEERDAVLLEKLETTGSSIDKKITNAQKAYDAAAKEISEFKSAADSYRNAVARAESSYKSVPVLSFDEENQKFIITLNASEAYKNSIFSEEMPVFAVDNSGNEGSADERSDRIYINYDGAAPAISGSSINVSNAVERQGTDGVKEYILRDGSGISVSVTDDISDEGGDISGIGVDSVMWKLGEETHGMIFADGEYRDIVSANDINGRNLVSDISIYAKDRLGNAGELSSMDAGEKFRIIIDSAIPEANISDISDENKRRKGDGNKVWYGAYSDVKIQLRALDPNPEVCSGLNKLIISINGRTTELRLSSSDISAEALEKGEYYISFEEDTAEDSFNAYLRRSTDESYIIPLGTGYYRLGRRDDGSYDTDSADSGGISVKFRAVDLAGLESSEHEQKVFLDLEDPTIEGVYFGDENIINNEGGVKFSVFSADETRVRIAVGGRGPLSGIKSLTVTLRNTDGSKYGEAAVEKTGTREWTAAIPVDFRGTVTVCAESNVLRNSDTIETYGIITESSGQHEMNASASVILPQTTHRDNNNRPLYSEDIDIRFAVTDGYSGLSSITVTPSVGSGDTVTINRDGSFDSGNAGWTADSTYYNLVNGMTGSMRFSGNSNGSSVVLGYSDNAGHGSDNAVEAEFSIDKTDPRVDVVFADQNNGGDQDHKNIYRSSRRAVVTVTERNFSESLVNVTVNGAERTLRWELTGGTAGTDTAQYSAPIDFEDDGVYNLVVKCTDLAGRASNEFTSETFTIDKTAPTLNVGIDKSIENDHYYHDNMTMTLRITDDNFDPSRINVSGTLNGSAEGFPKMSDWTAVGKDHVASIRFDRDGEYSLNVSGRDMAGNTLDSYSSRFCIDTTAPKIAIGEVEKANGGDEIRPRIRFNDTNLDRDSIKITLEGAKRGKNLPYDGEFVETSEGLDYVFDNFPARKNYDDIYTIKASAKDNAENQLETQVRFSVNRFGSTFEFDEDTQKLANKYIPKEKDIILTEYNVDKHSDKSTVFITKDSEMIELTEGEDYSVEHVGGGNEWSEYKYTIYAKNFESDARYTVSVHSVDAAGNINISDSDKKQAELTFCVDKTKPLCIPINISDNRAYKGENYTARLSVTDNIELKGVEVFIDGNRTASRLDNDECVFDIPNSSRAQDIKIVLTDMADNEIEYTYKNVLVTTNVARLLVRKTWVKVTGAAAVFLAGAGVFLIRRRKKRLL